MAIKSLFRRSLKELSDVRCLAMTGVLIALYIVLEVFVSINMGFLKINFAFLALAAIGMLYGPIPAMLAAIPCDILGAALQGNGLIFIFTLIAMFEGLVYGVFLYGYEVKKGIKQNTRIIISQTIVVVVSHLIFNTSALYFLGFAGKTYESVFLFILSRFTKNIVELPIDIVLLCVVLIPIKLAYGRIFERRRPT